MPSPAVRGPTAVHSTGGGEGKGGHGTRSRNLTAVYCLRFVRRSRAVTAQTNFRRGVVSSGTSKWPAKRERRVGTKDDPDTLYAAAVSRRGKTVEEAGGDRTKVKETTDGRTETRHKVVGCVCVCERV